MISRSQMNRQLYQMGGEGMQESQRDAQLSEQLQIEKAYRELVRRGLTEDEARQSIILQLSELKKMDNMPYAPSEDNDMYKNMPYAPSENEDMYKNMPYAPSEDNDMYKQEPNLLQPGEYAGENYKGSPDMYPDYEIDFQENNNRQMRQMGGISGMGMQQAPQEMQSMQQMDAEQYRPVAEQLAQDPNQALMAIVRMLMEQGIPEEEAIKIAKQMIQAVAEGGIEEVSDDTRVEARFGGRIGYAGGGISNVAIARETLQSRAPEGEFLAYINPEEAGILKALGGAGQDINATGVPSFFVKKVFKAAKSVVKGAAKAVKSVAKSPIGRIALTIAAGYYLGPMVSGFSSNPFVQGALRGGLANLAVQAVSGQKINFGEALTSAALGGVTQGFTQGQTGGFDGTEGVFNTSTSGGLENLTMPTASSGFPQTTSGGFGMDNIPVDSAASSAIPVPESLTKITGDFGGNILTPESTQTNFLGDYSVSNTPPVYKQTSFGKTIGEVETPLSQRYETFKSALGKENYLDALKQVSGVALDYPLTTIGGISTLASAMAPEIPEQLPGESMEEYRARVAEFERQYASNLSGRTGPSLPASARNPFYPVYAANGGRIGYQEGSGPLRPMVMSDRRVNLAPMPGIAPRENIFLNRKSMSEPNLIKQVTQQSFFNTNEDEKNTRYRLPASARNPFYEAMMDEQYTRSRLPTSARNPFYGISEEEGTSGRIGIPLPFDRSGPTKSLMANGGRMGYAMGNSVQEGIMAAPQIARQMGMPVGSPRMNEGGVSELDYRDEGGFVPPIGIKERADDIPAMLSNNEFVFTADAVKNAGGGDPNVGAQKMYTLMKRLESGGRV
jgi:hypothetical protein